MKTGLQVQVVGEGKGQRITDKRAQTGYKGAFEIAATVDYLFAFQATAHAVADHHFDAVFEAYLEDPKVRDFLAENNPAALREMAERLIEAQDRGLWRPRANTTRLRLDELAGAALEEAR